MDDLTLTTPTSEENLATLSTRSLAARFRLSKSSLHSWIAGKRPRPGTLDHLSPDEVKTLLAEIDRRKEIYREVKK